MLPLERFNNLVVVGNQFFFCLIVLQFLFISSIFCLHLQLRLYIVVIGCGYLGLQSLLFKFDRFFFLFSFFFCPFLILLLDLGVTGHGLVLDVCLYFLTGRATLFMEVKTGLER